MIKVRDQVQPHDLLEVQTILGTKALLDDSDFGVAIEILNVASKFTRDSLKGLKVIDKSGRFHEIQDIAYGNLGLLKPKETVNLAHPDIPVNTLKGLGIDSLNERLIKGMLSLQDVEDDDEFDQREDVTTRIADTLDRYPIETTFKEYLANADDAEGTSKVSWLLDKRNHAFKDLLTPQMKQFQGPALLVHNDGGKSSF
jgi:sacsin